MTDLRRFHFISGLPRSGSTLTAALLRQNPRFHAGMSSPIASLFDALIAQVSAGSEMASMVSQDQRKRFLRGLFDSYYAEQTEPVVFDTNRAWTTQLPALLQVFPDAKVICLVRDLNWIMDSMERQFRAKETLDLGCVWRLCGQTGLVQARLSLTQKILAVTEAVSRQRSGFPVSGHSA